MPKLRACTSNKNEVVGSRSSMSSFKNHQNDSLKQQKLMSCRNLLSRSAKNRVPAMGIEDTNWRAYTGKKSDIVGSRHSINPLMSSNPKTNRGCCVTGPHYRVLPKTACRQGALKMPKLRACTS